MPVIICLAFAAGALSCLIVERVFWPRVAPQQRGADRRFVRERSVKQPSRWIVPDPDLSREHYTNLFLPGLRAGRGKGVPFDEIRIAMGANGHISSPNAVLGFWDAVDRVKTDEAARERYKAGEPWPEKISQPILRARP